MTRRRWILGGAVLAVVLVGVGVWFLFFRDDAPAAVDLRAATEQLDEDLASGAAEETTFDGGINATWVVDNDVGDFDFDTASGSFAGFRVDEELTVGAVTAVGRTGEVSGLLTIEDDTLVAAEIEVDMGSIVSNDSRRERAIRTAVGAADFPVARFVLTEPVALAAGLADGSSITVDAVGELTVKGATNPVVFGIEAGIDDSGFGVITGSTEIVWEDYGVTPPSARIVVSVADSGTVEFQLLVRQT